MRAELREQVTTIIASIPAGRVTTYGRIAKMTEGATARSVGAVLRTLPEGHRLPWFRVVAAGGRLADHEGASEQRRLLAAEGVVFDERGRIPAHCFWPE
ncbi:methylated-DNA-protein-cysteine methyltransferase-like protein [Kushneria sinocarnis]|uniref:Methylated-DNA-protein-cysteine methyltransferase-like protein n=1 Tax=Kushneria sinocarnis TaxID=595502 RepID=A0A420WSM0_9GAMM|nr:MGMT family protein [Kushneria sinocarnis]RKQ95753.1 methylated-DNA-protein-cysteine methyltransferase-like protein [Kushneria sinocarnis]